MVVWAEGKVETECRPFALFALNPDATTVGLYDMFGNGQTEPCPAG